VLPFQWYIVVGHTRLAPLPVHGCCGPTTQAFAGDRTATSSGNTPDGSRMARQLVPSQRIAFARPPWPGTAKIHRSDGAVAATSVSVNPATPGTMAGRQARPFQRKASG
jgi:hypothetical protein